MRIIGILWLALVCFPVLAQDKPANDRYTILETTFIPPVYYVGDQVELRLTLKPKEGIQIVKSRDIPSQNWVLIKDIDVKNDGAVCQVAVRFVSFYPGTKTLPPIPLGDVVLSDLKIFTSSTIDAGAVPDAAPVRDQLPLPQTEFFIGLVILLVLVLPLVLWKLWKPARDRLVLVRRRWERRLPWRRLQKELKRLTAKAGALGGPDFYTQLAQTLKTYLSGRFKVALEALTASELEKRLAPLPPVWASAWTQLLRRADIIRFDGREPALAERLEDLESLRKAAVYLESREAARVDL